ncbi:hypothetical protein GDO81_002989 [Engystomops pustulosus]|uniref:Uncharacterized protein n=1 Tax=Engystomops pustulosus TaxID=76066 RepID=A0AAV7DQ41_ENGPU|nr:hypothetical protein GDO81_002989 [Engystomops pustulosus]
MSFCCLENGIGLPVRRFPLWVSTPPPGISRGTVRCISNFSSWVRINSVPSFPLSGRNPINAMRRIFLIWQNRPSARPRCEAP